MLRSLTETVTHPRFLLAFGLVVVAAASRFLPLPYNLTAVGAMAIFAGAMFRDLRFALAVPLAAMFVSDLALGMHLVMPAVYASLAASVLLGRWLAARRTVVGVGTATLLGAVQFFIVSNLAMWAIYPQFYAHTWAGLTACFVNAVPFFRYTLAGDVGFVVVLFGAVWVAEAVFPAVRERFAGQAEPVTA